MTTLPLISERPERTTLEDTLARLEILIAMAMIYTEINNAQEGTAIFETLMVACAALSYPAEA